MANIRCNITGNGDRRLSQSVHGEGRHSLQGCKRSGRIRWGGEGRGRDRGAGGRELADIASSGVARRQWGVEWSRVHAWQSRGPLRQGWCRSPPASRMPNPSSSGKDLYRGLLLRCSWGPTVAPPCDCCLCSYSSLVCVHDYKTIGVYSNGFEHRGLILLSFTLLYTAPTPSSANRMNIVVPEKSTRGHPPGRSWRRACRTAQGQPSGHTSGRPR